MDSEMIRGRLRQVLPSYMVPGFIVRLDRLPIGPNGKIDRTALPDARTGQGPKSPARTPATTTEQALAAIWRRVLQLDDVGTDDDFFELGGHSLKALQIAGEIDRELGARVPLREFFAHPTISGLADIIAVGEKSEWMHIPPALQHDSYELSHAQRRLWLLHQMEGATAYNMPEAHLIHADVDVYTLTRAFQTLIARHETLRTAIIVQDGEPRQKICSDVPFSIFEFDLRESDQAERKAREIADQHANLAFDLAVPPLLRAAVVRLPEARSLFLLTMHHVIGDGWSGNIVYREVLRLYEFYRQGRPKSVQAASHSVQGFCTLAEFPRLGARGTLLARSYKGDARAASAAL